MIDRESQTDPHPVLTPATWLNSAHMERWLRQVWPTWRWDDIRHDWNDQGRWYWILPDFERGRSRIIGVEAGLLEEVTVAQLRKALERANWLDRIDKEALLVHRDDQHNLVVSGWKGPEVDEVWFPDPRGGYFVAYPATTGGVSGGAPPRVPEEHLALHGKSWSALGPYHPRTANTYSLDELREFLPNK